MIDLRKPKIPNHISEYKLSDWTYDLERIPQRKPIISDTIKVHFPLINRNRIVVSERIRRQIIDNALWGSFQFNCQTAEVYKTFCWDWLYWDKVYNYLKLPELNEGDLTKDLWLSSKTWFYTPKERYEIWLERWFEWTEMDERMNGWINQRLFTEWITDNEFKMQLQKNIFKSDVALLWLMNELNTYPDFIQDSNNPLVELPSWIKLHLNLNSEEKNFILNINNRKLKKQIKDRVYKVRIWKKDYILKERKTKLHKDTFKNWHRDGLTSLQEYEVWIKMQEFQVNDWEIRVWWEKPLACVEYPNGYSFVLFQESFSGNSNTSNTEDELYSIIIKNKLQYTQLYQEFISTSKNYAQHPQVRKQVYRDSYHKAYKPFRYIRTISTQFIRSRINLKSFNFEDFAKVYANFLIKLSLLRLNESRLCSGYRNSDTNQYNRTISEENWLAICKVIGYDFEYFYEMNESKKSEEDKWNRDMKNDRHKYWIRSSNFEQNHMQEMLFQFLLEKKLTKQTQSTFCP